MAATAPPTPAPITTSYTPDATIKTEKREL